MELEGTQNRQNKLLNFKMYPKAIVIKAVWNWCKDKSMEQKE